MWDKQIEAIYMQAYPSETKGGKCHLSNVGAHEGPWRVTMLLKRLIYGRKESRPGDRLFQDYQWALPCTITIVQPKWKWTWNFSELSGHKHALRTLRELYGPDTTFELRYAGGTVKRYDDPIYDKMKAEEAEEKQKQFDRMNMIKEGVKNVR